MRTITTAQSNVLAGKGRAEHVKVETKDSGGTWRDLSSYPGFDAVKAAAWQGSIDEPFATAEITLYREQDLLSLAPLMTTSAINKGFDPATAAVALLALTREIRISMAVVGSDVTPVAGDYFVVFHGKIDSIDPAAGDTIQIHARDLGSQIADAVCEEERVYAFASVSGSPVSMRVWRPSMTLVLNEYILPTEARRDVSGSKRFYKVTTAGTAGTTEPAWPTSGTVADNTGVHTYQGTTSLDTGFAVESVIQNILNDNGLSAITLYTPTSPSWTVTQWLQERVSVQEALQTLSSQLGWDLRYKWRSGTSQFELTLYQPDRAESAGVQRTFSAAEYEDLETLKVDVAGIRNAITVVYSDQSDKDPTGQPKRKTVTVTDATSITAYGRRFLEAAENSSSQIDSSTEATTMANAILSDLKEPEVDHIVRFRQGFPWVELGDIYTFSANNRHYSSNQTLALYAYRHDATNGSITTTLYCRGSPSGGYSRWHALDTRHYPEDLHNKTLFEGGNGAALSAVAVPGGARLSVALTSERRALGDEYEYHTSLSSGFTPDSSTLLTVSRDREITVANLIPNATYYAKIVPRARNATKVVRAEPSAQVSFTAGNAKALHLDQYSSPGHFPYNGAFEHAFRAIATYPPDHWEMSSGTWGTQALAGTDGNGGRSIIMDSVAGATAVLSSAFPTQGGYYNLQGSYKTTGANAGLITFDVVVKFYKDSALTASTVLASRTHVITNASAGVWAALRVLHQSIPSDANFVAVELKKSASASDYKIEVGEIFCNRWDIAQEGMISCSLQNSWVDSGGSDSPSQYYIDSVDRVHLAGSIKNGTTTAGTLLFTLNSGYRPGYTHYFIAMNNGVDAYLQVASNGQVTIWQSLNNNTLLSLDGISFRRVQ